MLSGPSKAPSTSGVVSRPNASRNVEFTGPVYAPERNILFANIQEPGYMFAITGPWRAQR